MRRKFGRGLHATRNKILLRTPKETLAKMTPMTCKKIMEHIKAIPDDSNSEDSENEKMRRKTAKGGKKVEF